MEDTISGKMYPATKSSSLSRFRAMYLKYCKSMSITPLQCVVEASESELDMSSNCLTPEHCSQIAKCLQRCHYFAEANFSDCLIGDEVYGMGPDRLAVRWSRDVSAIEGGMQSLFNSLKCDYQLTSLIFKGNNICCKGAKLIGRILKSNTTLERLSLEWNNVGRNEDGFKEFCEGLVLNASLQYLDLRSNNIDQNGAIHLATVLLSNTSLIEVDLRWNNIGVIGGRALLSSLTRNHTLLTLSVEGSNVPSDVVEAIVTTLSLRFTKHVSDLHHKVETQQLSEKLQQLHIDKKHQISELLGKLDVERSLFLETTQLSQYEMADLKAQLQESEALLFTLEQRIQSSESALQESLNECEKQKQTKEAFEAEMKVKEKNIVDEVASLKQHISSLQEEHQNSIASAASNEKCFKQEISTLKSENQHLEDRCKELSISMDSLKREHSHELSSLQDQCLCIKEQHTQHLRQMHKTHQNEILVHMKRYDEHQAECQKRVSSYDEKVLHLEQEVNSLVQKLAVISRQAAEEAQKSGQSLKTQEIQNSYLQDQMQTAEKSAEKEREKMKELQVKVVQLEDELTAKERQIKEFKVKIGELNKQLEANEYQFQMSKKSNLDEVDKLTSRHSALNREVVALKQEYDDVKQEHLKMQLCHKKELISWMEEKEELQKSVDRYKYLLHQVQEEESQRTSLLKTALQNYLSASPKFE